jgi:hypothetical protein
MLHFLGAGMAGDDDVTRALRALGMWLGEVAKPKPKDKQALCLGCEATFNAASQVMAIAVCVPYVAADADRCMVSGVCRECAAQHDADGICDLVSRASAGTCPTSRPPTSGGPEP